MRFALLVPTAPADPLEHMDALAAASGLIRHSLGGAELFLDAETPLLPFEGIPGAVVGQLFRRGGGRVDSMPRSMALAIEGSDGRFAAEHCWGRYLAFWRDRFSGAWTVLRDPSGSMPAFHARVPHGELVFSDLETARILGIPTPKIDWQMVAHGLVYPQLPTAPTCLFGVAELLPGEALCLDSSARRTTLWSPWTFADRDRGEDNEPAQQVAAAVADATAQLADCYGRIVLELSGGLDSSILAACLAGHSDVRCLNLHTVHADGDERTYARLAAATASAPLEEQPIGSDAIELCGVPARPHPRPTGLTMLAAADRLLGERAEAASAQAVFSGTGGDNVFCYLVSPAPILDAWRVLGFQGASATAHDVSRLTGASLWAVARASLRLALVDRLRPVRWRADPRLVARGAIPSMQPHPWLMRPIGGRTGARAHIALLLRVRNALDACDRASRIPMIFPLMAQPVMEACLSIGSWRWVQGGRDRAVARQAFADRIPRPILERRAKGRLESLLAPAYDRDRAELRALLLDGELARQGLLDRTAVAAATARDAGAHDPAYARVLDLVDAELWVRGIARLAPT